MQSRCSGAVQPPPPPRLCPVTSFLIPPLSFLRLLSPSGSLFFSAFVGLSLLAGRGGALRPGLFPGRPSAPGGGRGSDPQGSALASPVSPNPSPDPSRELKTLREEDEGRVSRPQQAGEAQAAVGWGLAVQSQGPSLSAYPSFFLSCQPYWC